MTFKAHVRGGRIVLDEPTDLPEGTELALVEIAELDEAERQHLDEALRESDEDIAAGRLYAAHEVMAELFRQ